MDVFQSEYFINYLSVVMLILSCYICSTLWERARVFCFALRENQLFMARLAFSGFDNVKDRLLLNQFL